MSPGAGQGRAGLYTSSTRKIHLPQFYGLFVTESEKKNSSSIFLNFTYYKLKKRL